jgi:ABC-type branched-subunit amino acid transport system substrate-binding protein
LRQGVDPAGNVLAPAMPRYALSDGDIDALAAYLARIDATRHPGIGDTSIRVGTLLPASGRFAAAGDAVRDVLARYFDQLKRNGGVHGRRVELVIEARTDDDESGILAMNRLIADDDVFALVAPLSARIEHRLAEAADAAQIAVVGPLTLYPEDSRASSANVFHLLPGVAELAEVLAVHSIPTLGVSGRRVAMLCADDDEGRAIADRVEARFRERGYGALIRVPLAKRSTPSTLATRLVDADAAGIVVLANDASLSDVARVLARRETTVQWLFPAPLVPRDLLDWPAAYQGRIAIAYPTLPGDRTPSAALEFDALTKHDGTPRAFRALQAQAYSAASVLVEALSRGGRDLSRRKLVAALEGLHNFEPGLVPPITYNADRRIGSLGGYAVAVDLAARDFRPVGGFVRLQ